MRTLALLSFVLLTGLYHCQLIYGSNVYCPAGDYSINTYNLNLELQETTQVSASVSEFWNWPADFNTIESSYYFGGCDGCQVVNKLSLPSLNITVYPLNDTSEYYVYLYSTLEENKKK
jgi:hypothetical protein